jgi:L-cysteine desulfidase
MTRDLALAQTVRKFTNLLDGKVLSGISVAQVISYYESLILDVPTDNISRIDGITAKFMEDYINNLDNGD